MPNNFGWGCNSITKRQFYTEHVVNQYEEYVKKAHDEALRITFETLGYSNTESTSYNEAMTFVFRIIFNDLLKRWGEPPIPLFKKLEWGISV